MSDANFIDFYELLELSPQASAEAVELMFRALCHKHHPETGTHKNLEKTKLLAHAFQMLGDSKRRAAYDRLHVQHRRDTSELSNAADATSADFAIRHRMLSLFYAQRRRDMKQPGVGIAKLEELMKIPTEIIEFHLWYFKEKGWVQRETAGPFSITVAGVDEIESREREKWLSNSKPSSPTLASNNIAPMALQSCY